MAVALRNPTKRPITIIVTHEDAPKVQTPFVALSHDPKTGEVAQRRMSLSLPESLTLLGGEERQDLPDYVLGPALAAGLERFKPEPPAESAPAPAPGLVTEAEPESESELAADAQGSAEDRPRRRKGA